MTKHTPGPWHVETWTYDDGARAVPTIQTAADAIAQTMKLWRDGDDTAATEAANARLIAAAPDLLAACEAAAAEMEGQPWPSDHVDMDCDPPCSRCMVEAAIAKARWEA